MVEVLYENEFWSIPAKTSSKTIYDIAILHAAARGIFIPAWVPRRLIAEYADCAATHGEERAASHIRKIKAERQL